MSDRSPPSAPRPPRDEALRDQAVAWLVRVQSDAATADDWTALTAWLEASDAHRDAFDAVEGLSAEIDDNAQAISPGIVAPGLVGRAPAVTPMRRRPGRAWTWAPLAGMAAAAALAALAAPALMRSYYGAPTVYETGRGETRDIALADGSHIRLDAASRVTVRMGWRQRRVDMAQAEAAFDVATDPRRPFVVAVGDQQVRVVGTQFNIRHFDGATVVTVRRGVVEVRQPARGDRPVARLTVGDQLRHAEGAPRSELTQVDPRAAFAWTEGRMVCDQTPLAQVAADLNRRYALPIRVTPAVAGRRFSGVLELGDQDALVRRLAAYMSLTVHRTEREITLS